MPGLQAREKTCLFPLHPLSTHKPQKPLIKSQEFPRVAVSRQPIKSLKRPTWWRWLPWPMTLALHPNDFKSTTFAPNQVLLETMASKMIQSFIFCDSCLLKFWNQDKNWYFIPVLSDVICKLARRRVCSHFIHSILTRRKKTESNIWNFI